MDRPLITQQEVNQFRPTAKLDDNRVDPYIIEAQVADLKPVLNDALYLEFLTRIFGDTAHADYAKYLELLNGKNWTHNGQSIRFYGVVAMLSYNSLARFAIGNPVHYSRYGIVQKIAPQSEPVDPAVLREEVRNLKSLATTYTNNLILFLQNNRTTYPLYSYNESNDMSGRTAFKLHRA